MKRYLRRCAALLSILMMICCVPVAADGAVYFTAVNETVLKLSDATMPFWANGILYVPSDMFADKELGITYYNNQVTKVVTLYDSSRALQFDLDKGTAVDGNGVPISVAAVVRNGRVFFPVDGVTTFFGLTYSETKVARGYVVRIRSRDSVLNDRLFLDAATSLLEYRFEEYEKEKAQIVIKPPVQEPVTPDPPGPVVPPAKDERTVYLAFSVEENCSQLLDVLVEAEVSATFFFTETTLREHVPFVRRLMVLGYGIGLIADTADAAEQLRSSNELLWRLTGTKTRLCVLKDTAADQVASVVGAGYCGLNAAVDRSGTELTDAGASELYRVIHQKTGDHVTVWLGEDVSPAGLKTYLRQAETNGDRLAAMTETVLQG